MTIAVFGAVFIGLSLGLLGSGGSILTVPILVYVLGQPDKVAIAGSLAIVGGISLFGAIPFAVGRRIDWRSVLFFGVPGMIGSFGGAFLAQYVSGAVQLLLFSIIMLVAAVIMFKPKRKDDDAPHKPHPIWQIAIEGVIVGVITGLVGVGGGFLIVPALALLGGLPMHVAIGTSLLIIALKSFVGFFEYLHVLSDLNLSMDWTVVLIFVGVGVVGSLIGKTIGSRVPQLALQRTFAVFLLMIGSFILWQNAPAVF